MTAFLDNTFGGQGITNALTFLLIAVTFAYVLLTHSISKSTRLSLQQLQNQYEHLTRPVISASIVLRQEIVVCLLIKNTGHSIARDVRLSLDKDFYQFAEMGEKKNLREFLPFREPISSFAPGEHLLFMLSQGFNLDTTKNEVNLTPAQFGVSVSYKYGDKEFSDRHDIDLRHYFNSQPDIDDGVRELTKIRKAVEVISKKK